MQLLSLLAVATAVAAIPNGGNHKPPGHGHKNGWGLKKFKNLVAFGDSYTDESRLGYFMGHGGQAPPVATLLPMSSTTPGGGITWPRWVSIYSGASLFNYAVSGAVCSNNMIDRYLGAIDGPFPDVLGHEVPAFQADAAYKDPKTHKNTFFTDRKADNTVYSMWIGTNDLGNDAMLTDSTLNGETLTDYVDCVFDAFDGIYATGARHFVLMNVVPLDLSPLYGHPDLGGLKDSHYWPNKPANTTQYSEKMKKYSTSVNAIFDYRVPFEVKLANRYPGAHFAVFDTHRLISDIYNNPAKYLNGTGTPNVNGQYQLCPTGGGDCVNSEQGMDNFLWFDELHPSERADQVIATHFIDVVKGKSKYATYW